MRPETMRLVHILKQDSGSTIWKVSKWLSERNGCEQKCYNLSDIEWGLRETLIDYFGSCDDPRAEFCRLMHSYEFSLISEKTNISVWATFLINTQVKDENGNFVNGFTEAIEYE